MFRCVTVPKFNPDAGPPDYVYRKMARHLLRRMRDGDLAPGALLPGERELAADYGVALGTARNALAFLREMRVVTTLPGKGTYVVPDIQELFERIREREGSEET